MGDNIYTVTSVRVGPVTIKDKTFQMMTDSRAWGWYPTLDEVRRAAQGNYGDMCEAGAYTHIVVERVPSGVSSHSQALMWFKFDRREKPRVCKPPLENVCNFALG